MRLRKVVLVLLCAVLLAPLLPAASAQTGQQQSGLSPAQRTEVLRSRLETLRRTLNSAIAGLNAKDDGQKDSPRARLSGLEKETGRLLSEVSDLRGKQERAERFEASDVERLEAAATDLDTRVQSAMRETASARTSTAGAASADDDKKKKKKGGFFSRILGRGGDDKYDELVGTVAPGRDRQLFEDATKEARKDNYETARGLYGVIINTYPDSPYLPLAKLAIADTFYLEGTTSALIQAGQHYQDWFTFFPTHPLADDVMIKMAEVEMRQMGLPDRQVTNAKKAEQRLRVFMQQFPKSSLRPEVEIRLREVQENLAMHDLQTGNFYRARYYKGGATNLKGAQSRYKEVADKYPHFSRMAEVLYKLGETYVVEEEPDEAAKHYQRLVRNYPNCEVAEKAREQLAAIGASIPEPDPREASKPCDEGGQGFMGGIWQEITGVVQKTVDKNGVIIANDDKKADLISQAIENGGTLPDNFNTQPVERTDPGRRLAPKEQPAPAKPTDAKKEFTVEPTQPGAPKSGSDPTRAPATQPTAPATPPPPPANSGAKP